MTDDRTDDERRIEYRPTTANELRVEALRLLSEGFRVRDVAQILGMNDRAVASLINGDAL